MDEFIYVCGGRTAPCAVRNRRGSALSAFTEAFYSGESRRIRGKGKTQACLPLRDIPVSIFAVFGSAIAGTLPEA